MHCTAVAILYSSSQNSLIALCDPDMRKKLSSQSFIHQVRILSYSWEIPLWDNPGSLASQSFIHQVRILSRMGESESHRRWASQSFIHQVRILSAEEVVQWGGSRTQVAILYSSSQNSLGEWSHPYRPSACMDVVAILYSSSQNSLVGSPVTQEDMNNVQSRNPLFIKSEFSPTMRTKTAYEVTSEKSQSFIHQVRILSCFVYFSC